MSREPRISREEKKQEAIARMKMLGIFEPTISQFEKDDLVSESTPPFGDCYWLNKEQKERVRQFEEEYGELVYHVIHSYTNIGELENLLFVSNYKEDWPLEREAIKNGEVFAYCYNLTNPEFSESGMIGVRLTVAAGLERTW